MLEITKVFTFDAAHLLPNHDGKCRQLHGHTYRVEVTVSGEVVRSEGAPDEGMVIDFGIVKQIWKDELEPLLDHQYLNDTIGHQLPGPTTAENIAEWIALTFGELLPERVSVCAVSVWETPTGKATWYSL